jgi:ATP-dependent helicase HepA
MSDAYHILAAATQAARRRVEALTLARGGALGVAAEPYPHQVATAARILTDTRVRHLIADEVGLGKTVQALMVLNALRWQNPAHKATILVPDRLVNQWRIECWTRCHCEAAVAGDENTDDADAFVRIVRPESVQSGKFTLAPEDFDLLIVDEPQTMPVALMEEVERVAPNFRQLLILSATPGLGDPIRRQRIMKLLEPERIITGELTGGNTDEVLAEIEAEALAKLAGGENISDGELYRTYSAERRIVRARRAEWGRYLPERRYQHVSVEPLKGEVDRVRIGMHWLEEAGSGKADEGWRFAQALHRSNRSAQGVIAAPMRQAKDSGTLAAAKEACNGPGDTRFDALLDILSGLWAQDPQRQVVVVAGDNPTIGFLAGRLPRYFGNEEEPLQVTELRRASEATEDEAEDVREMHVQLEGFIRGKSKVLLVGEWVQAGLNLHYYARDIVFYCPPWEPEAIDQLIGRLDRLRPNGLRRGDSDRGFGRVRTWCITQRDTVEAKIVAGLEAAAVFIRPLPPARPEETSEMRSSLRALAFGGDFHGSVAILKGLAERWNGEWASSRLAELNPFTPSSAQAAYDRLRCAPLPEPVLKQSAGDDGYTARAEEAVRGWLDLMSRAHLFEVGSRRDHKDEYRFWTIWHSSRNAVAFDVPELKGRNSLDGHAPFVVHRKHLAAPPRSTVHTDDGERGEHGERTGRPLRFFDHGDALHESLIRGFAELARKTICNPARVEARVVLFPEGHPALALAGQTLLAQVAYVDPGVAAFLTFEHTRKRLKELADSAPTDAQKAALYADVTVTEDAWRADQRWLRSILPAIMLAGASRLSQNAWIPVADELKWELLKPLFYGEHMVCAKCRNFLYPPAPQLVARGLKEQAVGIFAELHSFWRSREAALRSALGERLFQVNIEAADLIRLRKAELAKRQFGGAGTAQLKEGQIAAAERRVLMAEAMAEARTGWLKVIPALVKDAKPSLVGLLVIRPVLMESI